MSGYLPPPVFEFLWFHLPGLDVLEAEVAAFVLNTAAATLTIAAPDAARQMRSGAVHLQEIALAKSLLP